MHHKTMLPCAKKIVQLHQQRQWDFFLDAQKVDVGLEAFVWRASAASSLFGEN